MTVEDLRRDFAERNPGMPVPSWAKRLPGHASFSASQRKAEFGVDFKERTISGYGSTNWVSDLTGDVVVEKSFDGTIAERGPDGNRLIKGFLDHEHPIGMPVSLQDDGKGLHYVIKVSDLPKGDEALIGARDGIYAHSSYAYDVLADVDARDEEAGPLLEKVDREQSQARPARFLVEQKLYELGPVIWPMNETARVMEVKSAFRRARSRAEREDLLMGAGMVAVEAKKIAELEGELEALRKTIARYRHLELRRL